MKLLSAPFDEPRLQLGPQWQAGELDGHLSIPCVASRSTIAVLVVCVDRIIGAGLVATLEAIPSLSVQLAEGTSMLRSEADTVMAIEGVDVIVADYESALTVARAVKRHAVPRASCWPRIMIVSQRDSEADVRRALECGVQGYLLLESDPVDVADGVIALHRGQRVLGRVVAQRMAESFDHEALTDREIDVLRLVAAGDANKLIARKLNIALGTVKVHVRSIMSKLDARTRTEAAAVAQRRGLVQPEATLVPLPSPPGRWPQASTHDIAASGRASSGLGLAHQR